MCLYYKCTCVCTISVHVPGLGTHVQRLLTHICKDYICDCARKPASAHARPHFRCTSQALAGRPLWQQCPGVVLMHFPSRPCPAPFAHVTTNSPLLSFVFYSIILCFFMLCCEIHPLAMLHSAGDHFPFLSLLRRVV